jgi:ATP-dependent protease Clp ATPase subunit
MAEQQEMPKRQSAERCSFCERRLQSVAFAITGKSRAAICDACVDTCAEAVAEWRRTR